MLTLVGSSVRRGPAFDTPRYSATLCHMKTIIRTPLPHPDCVAARKALAAMPPQPLEIVMQQAKASEEWRRRNGSAGGLKKPGT